MMLRSLEPSTASPLTIQPTSLTLPPSANPASIRLIERMPVDALSHSGKSPPSSSLRPHIGKVVGLCPQKEVVRPYTGRIVARVADHEPRRYRPEMKRVAVAVRSIRAFQPAPEEAIPPFVAIADPLPAPIALVDVFPKSLDARSGVKRDTLWHKHNIAGFVRWSAMRKYEEKLAYGQQADGS